MNKMLLLPNLVFRLNCPEFKSCNVYCAINVVGAFYIAQDVRKNGNYLVLKAGKIKHGKGYSSHKCEFWGLDEKS